MCPNFPPINLPDAHRVRTSLPYLRKHGYEPVILTLTPDANSNTQDPALAAATPPDVEVHRVGALPLRWTSAIGVRNQTLRAFFHFTRAGSRLIRDAKIDLVFISTTDFYLFPLGRYWKMRHGVPFVLDLQDPWYSEYYSRPGAPAPPGGRWKYGLVNGLAKVLEPLTLRQVAHVLSVSPAYPQSLLRRYSWLRPEVFTVLPFGAPERDFELLREMRVRQTVFDRSDDRRHWVYVGRGGSDMSVAAGLLFSALARARAVAPHRFRDLRLHFIGTSYASGQRAGRTIAPQAERYGVADLVEEYPERIPYFEALQCLGEADAVIVLGSDDPGYTASKVYPCILARKPLLAIFHERSDIAQLVRRTRAGTVVTFSAGSDPATFNSETLRVWLESRVLPQPETDWDAFLPYTAQSMTHRQCAVFDQVLKVRHP